MDKTGVVAGELVRAVAAACEYLVDCQDSDGHWRDYRLAPGRSESWITGCVGVALDHAERLVPSEPRRTRAVDDAVSVLMASRRRGGWGYNRKVGCDADSTSWAVRLIAGREPRAAVSADVFAKYLTATGGVRTYRSPKAFGRWADEHDDVAPMAGLALLSLGDATSVDLIRRHTLDSHQTHGGWKSFWWRSESYAAAHNLAFLACSGGVPSQVVVAEIERLAEFIDRTGPGQGPAAESSFDIAHRLIAAVRLGASDMAAPLCRTLLAAQLPDGGWPASLGLLVPIGDDPPQVYADDRRLLTTAVAVLALVEVATEGRKGISASRPPLRTAQRRNEDR